MSVAASLNWRALAIRPERSLAEHFLVGAAIRGSPRLPVVRPWLHAGEVSRGARQDEAVASDFSENPLGRDRVCDF